MILPAALATPAELRAGIRDPAALCGRIAHAYATRSGGYLTAELYEDLVSFLMLCAWTEAGRFDGRGDLEAYIGQRLKWRCHDWTRSRLGRRKHDRPTVVSFDDLPPTLAAA